MKKLLLNAVILSMFGFAHADAPKTVAIDTLQIMQKSLEGQKLSERIQKKVESYQEHFRVVNKELAELQEKINKASENKEDARSMTEELLRKKKSADREVADKEESLKFEVQNEQISLRNKQLTVVTKMAEENKWEMVVDKNTPGLIFAARAVDITDEALLKIDEAYLAEQEKATLTAPKAETKTVKVDTASLNNVIKKKSTTTQQATKNT